MRRTIRPDELGDVIAIDIARRIKDEIEQSDVIGPDLATKISWDSKRLTVNAGPDVPEPAKTELDRIVQKVLGDIDAHQK